MDCVIMMMISLALLCSWICSGWALTVIISIDGYLFDWIYQESSPFLANFALQGRINVLKPEFPTATFPNHYTILTGLRPETHGLVLNNFWDPQLGREFRAQDETSKLDPAFWTKKPIWVDAVEKGLQVSCIYFPSCDVEFGGVRPQHWFPFKDDDTPSEIVDKALESLKKDKPDMLLIYFDILDVLAHRCGPYSIEVSEARKLLDVQMERLVTEILDHKADANLIILSDHGFAYVPPEQNIILPLIVPSFNERVSWVNEGPVILIWPKKEGGGGHGKVWLREAVPEHLHFKNNPRISPIVLEAEMGWNFRAKVNGRRPLGSHGYDPVNPEMDAILILYGPQFTKSPSVTLDPAQRPQAVSILNIYPLLTHLLQFSACNEMHETTEPCQNGKEVIDFF